MDKKQFLEQMIESVRQLSISSILSSRMELKRSGRHQLGLCPFHNDNKIGSFVVTDSTGIFKCFSCDAGGDAIKYVSLLEGKDYVQSAFDVALEFGVINAFEYEEYYGRRRYSFDQISQIEKRYLEIDRKRLENDIAEDLVLDKVFRLFISSVATKKNGNQILSDEHKEHLKKERGLTDEEIREGLYFSFPTRYIQMPFTKELENRFKNGVEILSKVPGFYYEKENKRFTFVRHKGIGIGIKNAKGQVVGIQIRHDEKVENRSRYLWFSSSFASSDDKLSYGTSSGSPVDVVYPKEIKNRTVIITEGRFKAQILARETGSIVLSVQGVTTWRGILKAMKELPESALAKERYPSGYTIQTVLVAFDADMSFNIQVFGQAKKMTDKIEEAGYPIYYLNWDESKGKGIDDIYLNGEQKGIFRYEKDEWDIRYEKMLETMVDETGIELKNMPQSTIRIYFERFFSDIKPLNKNELSKKHKDMKVNGR